VSAKKFVLNKKGDVGMWVGPHPKSYVLVIIASRDHSVWVHFWYHSLPLVTRQISSPQFGVEVQSCHYLPTSDLHLKER
jgi:hypothetical protein